MGGGIVFGTYRRPDLAFTHARCLSGTTVAAMDTDAMSPELRACIEILDALPPEIRTDIQVEWEGDDDTPSVVDVPIDDVDGG
jgi:hypothetical protein